MSTNSCTNTPTIVMFPEEDDLAGIRRAKLVCVDCPSKKPCREAGETEDYGIWGGLTSSERKAIS